MSKSEIFDSFVKIAEEQGLTSKDSKKKLEETGRAGSDDISTIEALYGVKPDSAKGADYKKNIMEVAHPNSVVISPSYDKLNGLVENNIERQNILLHIVNKTPDGISTQRKYAQKELILALVRAGNDLDNHNQDKLRSLADHCLIQASEKKGFKKQAFDPLTWAVIASAAALLGGIYFKQHSRFISDGFAPDHQKLIGEIDDLLNSNTSWGVGYEYSPELLKLAGDLKQRVTTYFNVVQAVMQIVDKLEMPRDAKELEKLAKENPNPEVAKAIQKFREETLNLWPYLKQIEKDLNSESYKQKAVKDKGFFSKLIDSTQILHGGSGLVADDLDDVKHALQTYMVDIQRINQSLGNTVDFAQNAQQQLAAAKAEAPQAPSAAPAQPALGKSPSLWERGKEYMGGIFNTPSLNPATSSARRNLEEKLGIDDLEAQFMKMGK